jgi:hypothetical protein
MLLHPLTIWDGVRCMGLSYGDICASVPLQFHGDLQGILDALDDGFCFVQRELREQLQGAPALHWAWEGRLEELLGELAAERVEDRAGKLEQVQAMLAELGVQDSSPGSGTAAAASAADSAASGGLPATSSGAGPAASTAAAATEDACPPYAASVPAMAAGRHLADSLACPPSSTANSCAPDDSTPRACKEALYSSTAFHAALRYTLSKGCAEVASMCFNRSTLRTRGSAPCLLRGLILDCIRPGNNGTLPGYAPSPGLAQTHAKGWKRGPGDVRMARITSACPAATGVLSDEDLAGSILRLEGRDLVVAQLVCKQWQRLLVGDHRYCALVAAGRRQALEDKSDGLYHWLGGYDSYPYDDGDSSEGYEDYLSHSDRYSGYGST